MWVKANPPSGESPVHHRVLCEHLWVQHLAQGYLSSALKVFWHSFSTTSTLSKFSFHTENPQLPPPNYSNVMH